MNYYRANLNKVVKIQSLFRAKETREQYRQLTMGKNVTLGTIKNFVHLLDDSEADFQDEVKVERLRKKVVEAIRENQALESELSDLDVRIALVVQNVQSFDGVIKARKRGIDRAAAASLLAAHGDPFSGPNTLDQTARRKLELYQQLFYLLQTRGEYLSHLFLQMSMDSALEKNRRFTERVTLTIFGFGQDRREDFLLLKLFQVRRFLTRCSAHSFRYHSAARNTGRNQLCWLHPRNYPWASGVCQHSGSVRSSQTKHLRPGDSSRCHSPSHRRPSDR
jgi:Ras GTPase-activating-like protein IQGAP2/3